MGESSTRWLKNTPLAPIAAPVDGVYKQKLAVEKDGRHGAERLAQGDGGRGGSAQPPSSRDSVIPLTVR